MNHICGSGLGTFDEPKQKCFSRICRIDMIKAMEGVIETVYLVSPEKVKNTVLTRPKQGSEWWKPGIFK